MNLNNTNNLLTWIVTNDTVKTKDNTHLFTYEKTDNNTHAETFDYFIKEANLNLENSWYFNTALELAKIGHMVFCNIPDTNYLLIFCPDLKRITKTQKCFLSLIENILKNFEIVNIALYNESEDEFLEHTINGVDISSAPEVFVKK